MKMNLLEDLAEIAGANLQAMGYGPGRKNTPETVVLRYNNIARRIPPLIKWNVSISGKLQGLTLPEKEQAGLQDLLDRATAGASLTSRLSKRIAMADYRDLLLNCWGIHHFHLGPLAQGGKLSGRTDLVAYVHFDHESQTMHVIDVDTRGDGIFKQHLLATVEEDWPHLVDKWSIKGVEPGEAYSDQELTHLVEKCGVNVLVPTPGGRAISTPGGGISTTKHSTNDVRVLNRIRRTLQQLEETLESKQQHFESELGIPPGSLTPKLVEYGENVIVADVHSGKTIGFEGITA